MSPSLSSALVLSLLSAPAAHTSVPAHSDPNTAIIDVNLMAPVFGKASLEYEAVLGKAATVVIGPELHFSPEPFSAAGRPFDGYGLNLGLHFFPGGGATQGFWTGPELAGGYLLEGAGGAGAGFYGQLNLLLGYTFYPTDHFAISAGLGGGYHFSSIQVSSSTATAANNGLGFAGRLGIGYGW